MDLPPPPGVPVSPAASGGGTPAGTGWTVVAVCAGALAALGLLGTIWLLTSLPTHDDGGHGGDGATALAVLVLGGAWIAVFATIALLCGLVGSSKRHRAEAPAPITGPPQPF